MDHELDRINQIFTYTKHLKEDSDILFMNNDNREYVGKVIKYLIESERGCKRIFYTVKFEDETIDVDGETFRRI